MRLLGGASMEQEAHLRREGHPRKRGGGHSNDSNGARVTDGGVIQ